MTRQLVAGVDCSTQATKVVVVEPSSGRVVASARSPHTVTGTGGARETDPDQWWYALGDALAESGLSADIAAIAVAGQQHGLVVLDADGRPLRPAILWNDTRAAAAAAALRDDLGGGDAWADLIGVVPVASFTVAKWAWLRVAEPDVAAEVRAVCLPHDYLTSRLVGRQVTDRGDASGTGWWSTRSEDYADEVLDLDRVRLDRSLLPSVLGPTEPAGEVPGTIADRIGLRPGTLVAAGTGDNMAAAVGLALGPGTPVISLGTSGTAYAVAEKRAVDATGTVAGFADATGRFLPLAATLNCTLAVDRMAGFVGLDRDAIAPRADCVVLPYLDGERTPDLPLAAGSVVGLRHDTTGDEILRAAYEGAVASLLEALDEIDRTGAGLAAGAPLVLIGGGARGAAWQEVVGDLSGRALEIPAQPELAATGMAAQAAAALTGEALHEVSSRWRVRHGRQLPARPANSARLDRIREVRQLLADLHGSAWATAQE